MKTTASNNLIKVEMLTVRFKGELIRTENLQDNYSSVQLKITEDEVDAESFEILVEKELNPVQEKKWT